MKIDQRVQEIWSRHESVTDGLTDEGHSFNPPSASRQGINENGHTPRDLTFSPFDKVEAE